LKRGQECPVGIVELSRTPAVDVRNPARILVCLRGWEWHMEQLRIGITHHHWTLKPLHSAPDLTWLRPCRRDVSQTDDLVRRLRPQRIKDSVECREIAMNFRDERDGRAHEGIIPVRRTPSISDTIRTGIGDERPLGAGPQNARSFSHGRREGAGLG
jgi:hypothetical protein